MVKVSLAQQLEEVDRELAQRADVYPRLVSSRKMRQSMADYHVARMQAVRDTLVWLQALGPDLRAILALPKTSRDAGYALALEIERREEIAKAGGPVR